MHVYIPAIFSMLEAPKEDELFHTRGDWGFAVTEALCEFFTEGDNEELADVVFDEAARTSLCLLDTVEEKLLRCRVVTSVDVEAEPQSDMGDAVVKVGGPISFTDVAALRINVEGAESKVEAAIDAVDKADLGDEDAEFTVGDVLEIPLAWYDVAELGMVADSLQQCVLGVDEGDWVRNPVPSCMTQVSDVGA